MRAWDEPGRLRILPASMLTAAGPAQPAPTFSLADYEIAVDSSAARPRSLLVKRMAETASIPVFRLGLSRNY